MKGATVEETFSKWQGKVELALQKHAPGASKEDKEDLRQDILVAFLESRATLRRIDSQNEEEARAYAYSIARNVIIGKARDQRNRRQARSTISLDTDPESRKLMGDSRAQDLPNIDMDRALNSLSEDEQSVIRGLYFEGMSEETLAKELKQTRWWVRQRKEAAQKELKRRLSN